MPSSSTKLWTLCTVVALIIAGSASAPIEGTENEATVQGIPNAAASAVTGQSNNVPAQIPSVNSQVQGNPISQINSVVSGGGTTGGVTASHNIPVNPSGSTTDITTSGNQVSTGTPYRPNIPISPVGNSNVPLSPGPGVVGNSNGNNNVPIVGGGVVSRPTGSTAPNSGIPNVVAVANPNSPASSSVLSNPTVPTNSQMIGNPPTVPVGGSPVQIIGNSNLPVNTNSMGPIGTSSFPSSARPDAIGNMINNIMNQGTEIPFVSNILKTFRPT